MLEFVKKQRAGFYFTIVEIVFTLIALILFGINCQNGLFASVRYINPGVLACFILSLVCFVISLIISYLPVFKKSEKTLIANNILVDIIRIVPVILIGVAAFTFFGGRIENIGYMFGSDLYLGNTVAIAAVNQSLVGIVFSLIAWAICLIGIFFTIQKED